ncbi:MAG: glycosyltransferase family 2 protein [Candidatus Hydrogenedentes bacterium]|nr:glycosyltransferase family 2 protein [Candidatus Hydrogenedentota bacterium]
MPSVPFAHETTEYDLSVVICTRNRAESLRETLDHIVRDEREGIHVELVIVDNNSSDNTREVALSFGKLIGIRYLREDRQGKCHALNRALDEGHLGKIVAFLDDDMSVERGWLKGVVESCEKWPDHDIFSGRSIAIFPPSDSLPPWARNNQLHGWAFSVADPGTEDRPLRRGSFPSGNHFWVRSSALTNGRRFPGLWLLPEPGLLLGLQEDGCTGMWIGNVRVGHRVQMHLFDAEIILLRMVQFGKDSPYVQMPNPALFWKASLFRNHPFLCLFFCAANAMRWRIKLASSFFKTSVEKRFLAKIIATVRLHDNWETVCHWRRIRQFVSDGQIKHTSMEVRTLSRQHQ